MIKKGQAALEFLTTYGWAFLVILVMIGALAYFGVLNPQNRLPEKCFVGPGFGCTGQTAETTEDTVRAMIINNYGSDLSLKNITVVSSTPFDIDESTGKNITVGGELVGGTIWKANAIKEVIFYLDGALTPGERASIVFTIAFDPASEEYDKTAEGEVTAKVI